MEDMYQFTPRAQQVIALARRVATRLKHNFIGTEHLLFGLVRLGEESSAATVLASCGVNLDSVQLELEKHITHGPETLNAEPLLTPRVKKVVRLANSERQIQNHPYIGTEHLLLGILREGDGLAARVLCQLGLKTEAVRQRMLEVNPAHPPTEATKTPGINELLATAEELLVSPFPELHPSPRVLAALCAVNHIEGDEVREDMFLAVLAHLRDKPKA